MSTADREVREWNLVQVGGEHCGYYYADDITPMPRFPLGKKAFHVIEKSAYDSLKAELDEVKKERDEVNFISLNMKDNWLIRDLKAENERLRREIDKATSDIAISTHKQIVWRERYESLEARAYAAKLVNASLEARTAKLVEALQFYGFGMAAEQANTGAGVTALGYRARVALAEWEKK